MYRKFIRIYNFPVNVRTIVGTHIIIDLLHTLIETLLKNRLFPFYDVNVAKKYISVAVEKLLEFGDMFIPNWDYLTTPVHPMTE